MGGVFAAYLLTTGIIGYRWWTGPKQMPPPVALGGAALVFATTGLLAQADKRLGTTVAWAFTLGALVAPKTNLSPVVLRFTGTPPATDPQQYKTGIPVAPGVTANAPGPL